MRDSCVRSGLRIEIVTMDGHRLTVEGDFDGDALAKRTIANFIEKASRLYEQKRSGVSAAAL